MDVKVERLINDVQDIKNNFAGDIEGLKANKAERVEVEKSFAGIRSEILEHGSNIKDELDIKYKGLEENVKAIQDGNRWIIRLIVGAVILAGLGLILVQKQ